MQKLLPRSEFGDAPRQELIVVDIDQSARPTYACKREKATTGKTSKLGQNCRGWLWLFVQVKLLTKNYRSGYRHCIDDFEERYQQALKVLGHIDILRIDGGYLSASNLKLLENQLFCTKAGINLNCIKEGLKKTKGFYWKSIDKHTKIFDCGFMDIFPEVSQKYRLILVKGQKMKERRIPKNQRKQGSRQKFAKQTFASKGYRSYRITYQEIIFGILTNLSGNKVLVYEFYKQRQTVENYFRDSNWSFETSKLPSQKFRANQAYLWLISIVQNALQWFKRQYLPKDWQSCSYKKIRDELINRKAVVVEKTAYVQINFSIYFKHKEVHDFADKTLTMMKNRLDNGEPLENFWKLAMKLSLPEGLDIEADREILKLSS